MIGRTSSGEAVNRILTNIRSRGAGNRQNVVSGPTIAPEPLLINEV